MKGFVSTTLAIAPQYRWRACAQEHSGSNAPQARPTCSNAIVANAAPSRRRALRRGPFKTLNGARTQPTWQDSLAERSKAVAQGAIPQGRGFEPHSCQFIAHFRFESCGSEGALAGMKCAQRSLRTRGALHIKTKRSIVRAIS